MVINIKQLDSTHAVAYTALLVRAVTEHPANFQSNPNDFAGQTISTAVEDTNSFYLGAFDDNGTLCGIIGFHRLNRPKLDHKGTIFRLYVPEEVAGRGIGRRLLRATLDRARRQSGLEHIAITVTASNDHAVKLYETEGFKLIGHEKNALKVDGVYHDENVMALYI